MSEHKNFQADFLFETSWEVCNKIGGIYTVLSTKAPVMQEIYKDNLLFIGPDNWKDSGENPDFLEDKMLYRAWKERADKDGLRIKIGRWNIAGRPIAVLVDFTTFIPLKDEIFSQAWESYHLDSIFGNWDYVEPALFGYAAAKVIESFYSFHCTSNDRIVGLFHEWMTGMGVLYLKENVPQVATIFTTHATTMGRCLAGNGLPLYDKLDLWDAEQKAREFNVVSKHSLEKTAAGNADAFTTVSEITAKECTHFLKRTPDVITVNGFDDSFVPEKDELPKKRVASRAMLNDVATSLLDCVISDDALHVAVSGRYEYKNKGIDVFIEALAKIKADSNLSKQLIAWILIPANNYGPNKSLLEKMQKQANCSHSNGKFLTHGLHDEEYDPIMQKLKSLGFENSGNDKVQVIFVPSYLNGRDGIFNMTYYEVLSGMDLTVFPSYYEPWGYTPLESLAYHVPSITTSLSGFGLWVKNVYGDKQEGLAIIERNDSNANEVADAIAKRLMVCVNATPDEKMERREKAYQISRTALWENLARNYHDAFHIAIQKVNSREHLFPAKIKPDLLTTITRPSVHNDPIWRRVIVRSSMPEPLKGLKELSMNLWWSWDYEAPEMFESIDPKLWIQEERNPISFLNALSIEQIKSLESNQSFIEKLKSVYSRFKHYMDEGREKCGPAVAYFSMEYGLHDTVKIFSGGLGVLAGDYLKEASDQNINMVGIGLLYKYGYFKQRLSATGEQVAYYDPQAYAKMPIHAVRNKDGEWKQIQLSLPGRNLDARIWRIDVGRVPLFLLDVDFTGNEDIDREISHKLYGGNWENRLKQELLLGVGGIRALEELEIQSDVYHCNEGHAAFIGIERLRKIIEKQNLSFSEAIEIVRSSTLFTTHTPVPAGHDAFEEDILRTYIPHYAERLSISWNELMGLGRLNPNDVTEKFSMSYLAARLSHEINGVSRIHGKVSRKMFNGLWKGFFPEELHLTYVTNGVHYPTWAADQWRKLYENHFGKDFIHNQTNPDFWGKIYDIPDQEIWKIRTQQRKRLIEYVKDRTRKTWNIRQENPKKINDVVSALRDDVLTIGFARRFASYKRAHLLFRDVERLAKIVNNKERPVQFIFAGKAHPNDKPGQDLIKYIHEITSTPDFFGKILFVENYDIELGQHLVQGVDVWLNTPTRPLEASGTSGEKAVMNGVLNLSVLDGWWAEGYVEGAGWALEEQRTYENQEFQNELDAVSIYNLLENEVIPLFYNRNEHGIPNGWIQYVKKNIAEIAPQFTMSRMLNDYKQKFYEPLFERHQSIRSNDYKLAKQLASWKKRISRSWESIEVVSVSATDTTTQTMELGEVFEARIVLDLKELSIDDVGVEIVFVDSGKDVSVINHIRKLDISHIIDKRVTYATNISTKHAGIYNYGFRIFPVHPDLAHRQDFALLKWF